MTRSGFLAKAAQVYTFKEGRVILSEQENTWQILTASRVLSPLKVWCVLYDKASV